jgi:glycosyltransferase involved in cell wall biosynthesis
MRIAHVIAGPYPAWRGSQVLVKQLVGGLAARGHEVHVVSYGTWLRDRPGFHPGRVALDMALGATLWRVVHGRSIDVVHAHNYEAGMAAMLVGWLTGVPFVFHGHSAMAEEMPLYVRRPAAARAMRRLGRLLDRTVPRMASACVAVTDDLARRLRTHGAARVESLPPVLALVEAAGGNGAEAAEPTVCYAGNLDAYQNLDLLLAAFEGVRTAVSQARLVLVSHPDAARAAAALARAGLPAGVEIVHAASYEEVSEWLGRAHVLVLPRSESTGFPMKLLNYMAAGKPIVVAAGSAKGLRDGEHARVVADHDVDGFTRAIVALLADAAERRRLGCAARDLASDPRTFERSVAALERLYDEVVGR